MKRIISLLCVCVIALCGCSKDTAIKPTEISNILETDILMNDIEDEESIDSSESVIHFNGIDYINNEVLNLYLHISYEKSIVCDESLELVPKLKDLFDSWGYDLDCDYYVARSDTRVVSFVPTNFPRDSKPICIDSQSGEPILIDSVLDTSYLADIVNEKVTLMYDDAEKVLSEFDETDFDWYLGYDRLYICFGYESLETFPDIGWYNYSVEILFDEYKEIFNPYYCETPEQYSVLFRFNIYDGPSLAVYDIGKDNRFDYISIKNSEDNTYGLPATLRVNDLEYIIESDKDGYSFNVVANLCAIIHIDDRDFLVCCLNIPEREMQYNIYDISNDQIKYICCYSVVDEAADFSNPKKITFVHPCSGLFHLPSYVYAHFSSEGEIVIDSKFQYAFDFVGEQEPMSADFDIEGVEVDEEGSIIGSYTITAGTSFILYRTSLIADYADESAPIFNDLLSENHIVRIFIEREIDETGYVRYTYNGKYTYEYYQLINNYKIYQW